MRHDGADVQITTVPSTSFLQTDPEPGGSANAYDYCSQGPINCYDLDGQWGWSNVKKWWKKHGKTTLMVVGTVAAVVAIGTGVGALAGVGMLGMEASTLATVSTYAAAVGAAADAPGCFSRDVKACVGMAANLAGVGAAGAATRLTENSLAWGFWSAKALSVGVGAGAWDSASFWADRAR